jgi:hypothetical protein
MLTDANFDIVLTKTPGEREEMFPMQEQEQGVVGSEIEKSASAIFSERLKESKAGDIAPLFIP